MLRWINLWYKSIHQNSESFILFSDVFLFPRFSFALFSISFHCSLSVLFSCIDISVVNTLFNIFQLNIAVKSMRRCFFPHCNHMKNGKSGNRDAHQKKNEMHTNCAYFLLHFRKFLILDYFISAFKSSEAIVSNRGNL